MSESGQRVVVVRFERNDGEGVWGANFEADGKWKGIELPALEELPWVLLFGLSEGFSFRYGCQSIGFRSLSLLFCHLHCV